MGAPANPSMGELATTTLNDYVQGGKFFQQITVRDPLWYEMNNKGFVDDEEPGNQIQINLITEDNDTFKPYARYEKIDLSPQDGLTAALFTMKQYAGSVSIDGMTSWQNSGGAKIVGVLDGKKDQLQSSARKQLSADLWSDGTAYTGKQIQGLALAVQDMTSPASYGGIDRATYLFWRNQWIDASASGAITVFGVVGQKHLRRMHQLCRLDGYRTDLILSDENIYNEQEAAMVVNERWDMLKRNTGMFDAGIDNFMYKDAAWVASVNCTAGEILFLNTDTFRVKIAKGKKFVLTPFFEPNDQDAMTAKLMIYLNAVCISPRYNGRISKLTVS